MSSSETRPDRSRARVILSDFHLGEGRRNWDGTLNLLEDFHADARFVEFLDYLDRAYDEVELVLAGNFFEMLRCRMDQEYPDILYETYALELIRVQMEGHSEVIEALRRFMEKETHQLIYLVGEADIGVLWPRVQEEIRRRVSTRVEFKGSRYEKDGILVEHGDQWDEIFAFDWKEPFCLVDGVPTLKLPWGTYFYAHFVQPLRRIRPQFYRVKPIKNYLMWTALFETRFFWRIIRQFFLFFWKAASRRHYPGSSVWDLLKIFRGSVDSESLEARAEALLQSDQLKKVIFGYSHLSNYRQFRNGKEYFNTGSWTRSLSLDMRRLGSSQKLNYVLIEFREEPQAKLMEWQGKYEPVAEFL